jgi:hypothetical protein
MAKAKVIPEHRDRFDRVVSIGDYVVFPIYTRRLGVGTIVKMTPKMIRIAPVELKRNQWGFGEFMKYSADCIKMDPSPALTLHILKLTGQG